MKRLLPTLAVLTCLLGPLGGCATSSTSRPAPEFVVFGPASLVPGPVTHTHGSSCGHTSRWFGGRWVYWNGRSWEYLEGGRAYRYLRIDSVTMVEPLHRGHRPPPRRFGPRRLSYGDDVRPHLVDPSLKPVAPADPAPAAH